MLHAGSLSRRSVRLFGPGLELVSWSRGNSVLSSLLLPFMTYISEQAEQAKQAMLVTKSREQQSQSALHVSETQGPRTYR